MRFRIYTLVVKEAKLLLRRKKFDDSALRPTFWG